MPKRSLQRRTTTQKDAVPKIHCGTCGKEKSTREFYRIFDDNKKIQRFFMCKECMKAKCSVDGKANKESFKNILRQMDRPYITNMIDEVFSKETDPIGVYLSYLALPTYVDNTWEDSIIYSEDFSKGQEEKFTVTDRVIEFFGAGYSEEEYAAMEKKYNFLKNNYPGKTNMHVEALLNYVRPQVKCELATAKGNVGEAKTWAAIAKDAAVAAKINPSQLSAADLQGGLNNFSRLVQAVEAKKDIIKIMPRFKYMPQDAPDFIIWCFVNYIRDLKGLPQATYADIYQFYDKKKDEYIEQYGDPFGIFDGDIDVRNRSAIEKFVLDYGIKVKEERQSETKEENKDVFGGE